MTTPSVPSRPPPPTSIRAVAHTLVLDCGARCPGDPAIDGGHSTRCTTATMAITNMLMHLDEHPELIPEWLVSAFESVAACVTPAPKPAEGS